MYQSLIRRNHDGHLTLVVGLVQEDVDELMGGGFKLFTEPPLTTDVELLFVRSAEDLATTMGLQSGEVRNLLDDWLKTGPLPLPTTPGVVVIAFTEAHVQHMVAGGCYRLKTAEYFGLEADLVFLFRKTKPELFAFLASCGFELPS